MTINWKQAFDAVQMALGVIAGASAIPGVNMIPYIGVVSTAAAAIKAGLNAGVNVAPYVKDFIDTFKDGLPSQEQIDALHDRIKVLEAEVDAPLPPPEPGEPD